MRLIIARIMLAALSCLLVAAPALCQVIDGTPKGAKVVLATFFSGFLSGLRAISDDFEADTGIALEVQGVPYLGYQMWLHARFLGENPPEVLLIEDPAMAWKYGQAGHMVLFDELITRPNPLDTDSRPWSMAFREPHIQQSLDTNGHLYLIPYTQFGVGFFYNRDQYAACNLEEPASWAELIHNLRSLKEAGYTPFVTAIKPDDAQSVWIANMLLECLMRVHVPAVNKLTHDPEWVFDPNDRGCTLSERIDISERIVAFENGMINPVFAPEFAETARLIQEMSQYWRPDFLSMSGIEIYRTFASGKTAHMMNGTWYLGELGNLQRIMREVSPDNAFTHGIFPFPRLTTETTSLARAGGINQNAGMRACLVVTRTKRESWREQAGILLCHYLTRPEVARKVFEHSKVYDIPAVAAVSPRPETDALLPREAFAFLPVASFAGYDPQSTDEFWTLWQGYLGKRISPEAFLEGLSSSQRRSLKRQAMIYHAELNTAFLRQELGDAAAEWINP